ncbi:hypothetical protein A4G26_02645 [Mycobacterium kansasii]|nr:hypothetical protein A4G26_02645 [Mycobacterium kansasii]
MRRNEHQQIEIDALAILKIDCPAVWIDAFDGLFAKDVDPFTIQQADEFGAGVRTRRRHRLLLRGIYREMSRDAGSVLTQQIRRQKSPLIRGNRASVGLRGDQEHQLASGECRQRAVCGRSRCCGVIVDGRAAVDRFRQSGKSSRLSDA